MSDCYPSNPVKVDTAEPRTLAAAISSIEEAQRAGGPRGPILEISISYPSAWAPLTTSIISRVMDA